MAKTAREEGFAEIADWFETLAKAEKSHAGRFQQGPEGSIAVAGTAHPAARSSMESSKARPLPGLYLQPQRCRVLGPGRRSRQEIERVFEICHGCRLCFNLCPSFPGAVQGRRRARRRRARSSRQAETDRVIDTCFQCKICYVKCPYTPDDKHEFQLDFPRLMLRANAVPQEGTAASACATACSRGPRLLGRAGGPVRRAWPTGPTASRCCASAWRRRSASTATSCCPTSTARPSRTGSASSPRRPAIRRKRCCSTPASVNYNKPQVGKDAVEVFAQERHRARLPEAELLRHAGAGSTATSSWRASLARAERRVAAAARARRARRSWPSIPPAPTCCARSIAELVGTAEAREVARGHHGRLRVPVRAEAGGPLQPRLPLHPGQVAYHLPCHLKAQNIGYRSRDLMRLIPGATIKLVEQCCGHDGTWAMKKEFFPLSMLAGKKAFDEMAAAEADVLATDCPLAAIQFDQALGTRPIHPIQVLARAYRPDGFPHAPSSRTSHEAGRAFRDQEHRRVRAGARDAAPADDGAQGPPPRPGGGPPDLPVREPRDGALPDPGDDADRAHRRAGGHRARGGDLQRADPAAGRTFGLLADRVRRGGGARR